MPASEREAASGKTRGAGRLLVFVYAIFAAAATARGLFQVLTKFSEAPLAYILSLVAGAVYIVVTVALAKRGAGWDRVAVGALLVELVGVVGVGALSVAVPQDFPKDTVWSGFGRGYGFIPLVLPLLGLWWMRRSHRS
ncbi:hypothetical protein [Falsarthrobacter nasiphocae]|uniref:Integral membrane protein n=1 Tax=Falsarthrobacter nasiphocae TaxID=189863 RepID=A0AAE3YI68_9MICC|nr:hypothetical protein [Falsarthrobacter nasiphocae]MDR6892655.1 hypothetical protein [Falsarthrobacter nasiphocae]